MTAVETSPECQTGVCRLCVGKQVVKRAGAPSWEAPIMTLRCGHACHRKGRSTAPPVRDRVDIPEE